MRRYTIVGSIALLALVLAGAAFAGNAGFAPLPPHSPNAARITDAYWVVFGFTAAIFLIVETALVTFIVKYRGRDRTLDGAQVHGHTRLELIWTVIPVLILAAIGTFIFYKLPGIKNTPPASAANRIDARVIAHQFYWEFRYPDGQVSINELHVPVHEVVDIQINSEDVIHSFWVPSLGGKTDAIPGKTNHIWYQPDTIGVYQGRCAEFCGLYHARMPMRVIAEERSKYDAFLQAAPGQLGKALFTGACQTCHGIGGKGDYGPALAGNVLVSQTAAVEQIVRNGRGRMPPVGSGWTTTEMTALTTYLKQHVAGAPVGG